MKEHTVKTAQVVASFAHDLRSPLNAVIGFSRLMLKGIDGPLSDVQASDLQAIHENGKAMLSMVDTIIDLSKVEAGWLKSAQSSVYVQPLLEKVVLLATPLAREQQVTLTYAAGDGAESVMADPSQLQKAVLGLIAAIVPLIGMGTIVVMTETTPEHTLVHLAGISPTELGPDVVHSLEAFRTAGASADHRVDVTALQFIASSQLLALNGCTLDVQHNSETEIRVTLCFPLAAL
jgi:K+-sensing histidine kinase KdpD